MSVRLRLLICGAVLILPAALAARAQDLSDCASMVKPVGAPEYLGEDPPEHRILCRMGYLLSNNLESKVPDWAVEELIKDRLNGSAVRRNNFKADDELPVGLRAEKEDYVGSGFDRGHMAPAEDMSWDQDAMNQSFLLSNMAPQEGPFNGGIWAQLEKLTRGWAELNRRVVVITGPVYAERSKKKTIGSGKVEIPIAFYKIVYNPKMRRAIGFQIPNEKQTGRKAEDFIVKIRNIEDETGIDFFPKLSQREQDRLETIVPTMWRKLVH